MPYISTSYFCLLKIFNPFWEKVPLLFFLLVYCIFYKYKLLGKLHALPLGYVYTDTIELGGPFSLYRPPLPKKYYPSLLWLQQETDSTNHGEVTCFLPCHNQKISYTTIIALEKNL